MLKIVFVVLAVAVGVSNAVAGDCNDCITNNNIEDAAATCAIYKAYLQCLDTHTEKPCNLDAGGATQVDVKKALCTATDIPADSICKCQQTYWSSAKEASTRCVDIASLYSCVTPLTNAAKDCGDNAGDTIMTAATAAYNGASPACTPALTETCKCEVAAGIKDKSDNTKLCAALSDELTCLEKITATTEKACSTSSTQAAVKTVVMGWKTTNKCSTGGDSGAVENVFTATSLVLALLATYIF